MGSLIAFDFSYNFDEKCQNEKQGQREKVLLIL